MAKHPWMLKRDGIYYMRAFVPADLIPLLGKTEVWRSLRTTRAREAARTIKHLAAAQQSIFEKARRAHYPDTSGPIPVIALADQPITENRGGRESPLLREPSGSRMPEFSAGRRSPDSGVILFGELIDEFMREKHARWSPKTEVWFGAAFKILKQLVGPHRPITDISREACKKFRDTITSWPLRLTNRPELRELSLIEVAARAKMLGLPTLKPKTINHYLSALFAVLEFAKQELYIPANPASGLKAFDPVDPADKRNSYTTEQLNTLFSSKLYSSESFRFSPSFFWLPLLSVFHGLRMNEGCQLSPDDVFFEHNIPVFRIARGTLEGRPKFYKSRYAMRLIPIHPTLLEIGFMNFAASLRNSGLEKLMYDVQRAASGYYSDVFSKRFHTFSKHLQLQGPPVSFHSLRHSFRDATRVAGFSFDEVRALGGWTPGRTKDTADDYGNGLPLAQCYEAIKRLRFDGLDLSHVYACAQRYNNFVDFVPPADMPKKANGR